MTTPMTLRLQLVPDTNEPPPAWLEAARAGLAPVALVEQIAREIAELRATTASTEMVEALARDVAALRQALDALAREVQQLIARVTVLDQELIAAKARLFDIEPGRNVRVTARPGRVRIDAIAGAASYVSVTGALTLTDEHNGAVLHVGGDGQPITIQIPTGLPLGFACLVRQTGARGATCVPAQGVTIVPSGTARIATAVPWQEVSLEVVAPNTVLARNLP